MKKFKFILFLFIAVAFFGGCTNPSHSSSSQKNSQSFKHEYVINSTPTLIFHGALSSYQNEEHLANTIKSQGLTNSIIRVDVSADGRVKFIGNLPRNAYHPLILVNYKNNIQLNYQKAGRYATNVVKALQEKYGITKMNMVAHSLGNMSILYYMLENGTNKKMPQLQKQVDIAGYFDGIDFKQLPEDLRQPAGLQVINGKPNKMNSTYRQLTKLRKIYPNKQVDVLNIIGNTGNNSDGVVSNQSSLSLAYLLQDRAKSYQTAIFYGSKAEHGRLTFNSQVEARIINFLWG